MKTPSWLAITARILAAMVLYRPDSGGGDRLPLVATANG